MLSSFTLILCVALVPFCESVLTYTGDTSFLVASFPDTAGVGSVLLPDTVWRPLVTGVLKRPEAICVDSSRSRLFVADKESATIYWYKLRERRGLLNTDNVQRTAVAGYIVTALSTDDQGNLYFTGTQTDTSDALTYPAIYILAESKIEKGISSPVEMYAKYNTRMPNEAVWNPSGLSVDGFNVYWGNSELGTSHGALLRAPIDTDQKVVSQVDALSMAVDNVTGVGVLGQHIYFLSFGGIYAMPRSASGQMTVKDDSMYKIANPLKDNISDTWSPAGVAFDSSGTLYFTDTVRGEIYSIPATGDTVHMPTLFASAPHAVGLALFQRPRFLSSGATSNSLALMAVLTILVCHLLIL